MKLNLGAGCEYREDWVNHQHPDTVGDKAERCWDLNVYPWKCFKDAEFDLVDASHVIEHLDSIVPAMKELGRIIKPGGVLIMRVPHCSRAWTHSMHKIAFPLGFYGSIVGEGWLPQEFDQIQAKLCWNLGRIYRSKCGKMLTVVGNALLNPLANAWPMMCERIWSYWVGGFDEVEFVFKRR